MATNFRDIVNRILSGTLQGQQRLFEQMLATHPRFRDINPIVERGLGQQFSPLAAQYAIEAARYGNENKLTDFSDFANRALQENQSEGSVRNGLESLRYLFPDEAGPGFQPLSEILKDPNNELRRQLLSDKNPFAQNIIEASMREGLNPLLQQFVPEILDRRINRFRGENPGAPSLFGEFVRRGFRF